MSSSSTVAQLPVESSQMREHGTDRSAEDQRQRNLTPSGPKFTQIFYYIIAPSLDRLIDNREERPDLPSPGEASKFNALQMHRVPDPHA